MIIKNNKTIRIKVNKKIIVSGKFSNLYEIHNNIGCYEDFFKCKGWYKFVIGKLVCPFVIIVISETLPTQIKQRV